MTAPLTKGLEAPQRYPLLRSLAGLVADRVATVNGQPARLGVRLSRTILTIVRILQITAFEDDLEERVLGTLVQEPDSNGWIHLETWRLDQGSMHKLESSMWDASILVFTEYVGTGCSIAVLFLPAMNIFIELLFCRIIFTGMLQDPVNDDMLTSLLRFRAGAAHSVDYADQVSMKSMATQICEQSKSLHLSGLQLSSYEDMKGFTEGAMVLCILAQFAWLCTLLLDLNCSHLIGRGPRTILMPDAKSLSSRGSTAFISATGGIDGVQHGHCQVYNRYRHTCSLHVALRCDSTAYHRIRLECWWCSASWCHC